jgi:hypothetical protein
MQRTGKNHDRNLANLKELMTAAPTTVDHYAAIMRRKVEVRRMVEDALEEAKMRREAHMEG